jgi:hypothetical protein
LSKSSVTWPPREILYHYSPFQAAESGVVSGFSHSSKEKLREDGQEYTRKAGIEAKK